MLEDKKLIKKHKRDEFFAARKIVVAELFGELTIDEFKQKYEFFGESLVSVNRSTIRLIDSKVVLKCLCCNVNQFNKSLYVYAAEVVKQNERTICANCMSTYCKTANLQYLTSRFGERLAKIKNVCRSKASARDKKFFEKKYGEEEGKIRHKEKNSKAGQALTLQGYINKYGEEEGKIRHKEKNSKLGFSIDNLNRIYGEELAKEKYIVFSKRSSTSLESFKEKYGEEEGSSRWKTMNSKHGQSYEKFIERHGEEKGQLLWDKYIDGITLSLDKFKEKYGEEEGTNRYLKWRSTSTASLENMVKKKV